MKMVDKGSSSHNESASKRDWTKGPVIKNLLVLSWPLVIMETLYAVSQIVDMIWVGKLGAASIAGVGIANIIAVPVMSMDMGLIIGARAMISRYIGAGDLQGANHVAGQALIVSAIWGLFVTVIGVAFLSEPILGLFGMEPEVTAEGVAYLRIMFAGWVTMSILVMGLYAIQSSGDAMGPMKIEFLIRVVHVTLCPFLVLGWWIFPRLGVSGAALSNVISQSLGAVIVISLLLKGDTRLRLTLRDFHFSPVIIWRILKIGIPALIMYMQRSIGNFVLTWLLAPFGSLAIAAHSLTSRVDMFLALPGMAFSNGAGVLVGQNLGAGQPGRAERNVWSAVGFVELFLMICSAAILLWAEYIIGIFTTEPQLVEITSAFLRIATAGYLVMAFVLVLQSCIAGAGDTLTNMIVSIAMVWVLQLPLAFILSRFSSLAVFGVRWAIVVSTFAGAIAYVIYFRLGKWKAKQV